MNQPFLPTQSYVRVAAATPVVHLAEIEKNRQEILKLYQAACADKVALVVFPELCITGYTIGDLLHARHIIDGSLLALRALAKATRNKNCAMIVGAPLMLDNALYNCAVLLADGAIQGIVPKQNLPTYREFYEKRWFQSWSQPTTSIRIGASIIPFGTDLIFDIASTLFGIEICEDVWVANQPSIGLVSRGAQIICNPSASPEIATKAHYRRQLIANTSARLVSGYIYAGADPSESTTDIVMGGHSLIYQAGRLLAERAPFSLDTPRLLVSDIDIDRLQNDRLHDNNFPTTSDRHMVRTQITRQQNDLRQVVDTSPFTPKGSESNICERLEEIYTIQAFGLKKRLEATGASKVIIGLSGGLDSTLALLVAVRTAHIRKLKPKDMILTLTMPGNASSQRTQSNAQKLASSLGIENRVIPIADLSSDQLRAIGHRIDLQDVTYENTQARLRTALLFNTANQEKGLVLGTGDLSEIALGWCTYNGDHMSGYNVNASIPKTLVRSLVGHAAATLDNQSAQTILQDILDTPVSPELTQSGPDEISQKTEDLIGPYELHDFFLYNFIRWMDSPRKLSYLAKIAFADSYTPDTIDAWLALFLRRFAANQWKRSVMTDGPKVGSVSLSPRGDWRMPSDVATDILLDC